MFCGHRVFTTKKKKKKKKTKGQTRCMHKVCYWSLLRLQKKKGRGDQPRTCRFPLRNCIFFFFLVTLGRMREEVRPLLLSHHQTEKSHMNQATIIHTSTSRSIALRVASLLSVTSTFSTIICRDANEIPDEEITDIEGLLIFIIKCPCKVFDGDGEYAQFTDHLEST